MQFFDNVAMVLWRIIKLCLVMGVVLALIATLGIFVFAGLAIWLVVRAIAHLSGHTADKRFNPSQDSIFKPRSFDEPAFSANEQHHANQAHPEGRVFDAEFEVVRETNGSK